MVWKLVVALALMAFCVTVHAAGLTTVLRRVRNRTAHAEHKFWDATWLMIVVAAWAILLHLTEILAWALFYSLQSAFPDFTTSAYFSAVTYTTTGYGDLVLPKEWRIVGGVEALTGILMCGLSAGLFFAVFAKVSSPPRS